jgi:hypothetical protein
VKKTAAVRIVPVSVPIAALARLSVATLFAVAGLSVALLTSVPASASDTGVHAARVAFDSSSSGVESAATTWVKDIMDSGVPNVTATARLMAALSTQDAAAATVALAVPDASHEADAFHRDVAVLERETPHVTGVLDMRPFWEDMSKLLVADKTLRERVRA